MIKSKSQLTTDNNNWITSNNNNSITGAILNQEHQDFIDSFSTILNWINGSAPGSIQLIGSTASGTNSVAEGTSTIASGLDSHAEGLASIANNGSCHAEGYSTTASGQVAHSQNDRTTASGNASTSMGRFTNAAGDCSIADGTSTYATAPYSHASGSGSTTYVKGEYATSSDLFYSNGDAQYTRFVRNVVVSDTGIGTETTIETYPMTAGRYISFNIYGGLGVGLTGDISGLTYGGTGIFNAQSNMFQNIGGVLTKYDGSTSIDMFLDGTSDDQTDSTTIKINLKDDGSGNVLLYATLYNNNTYLYDITGTANLTIVFETLSISTT